MSVEVGETQIHIENIDVDIGKENGSLCEITSDSGVDTVDSCSGVFGASSDSETSPVKHIQDILHDNNNELESTHPENESCPSLSFPVTISPTDSEITDVMSLDESPIHENGDTEALSTENISNKVLKKSMHVNTSSVPLDKYVNGNLNINALATSSSSLDEQNTVLNSTICKSPLSKSAENISVEHNNNANDLNAEKILAEFTNKKTKVGAVQKIPEAQINQNIDVRYTRIPKEILSQDLGSIVKNVHGIFSSVSGSLKSAYNSTHRVAASKPPAKTMKVVPNGKVINEIFEDNTPEETPYENGADKSNENVDLATNLASVNEIVENTTIADGVTKEEMLRLQVESLERVLGEQRKENASLREKLKHQLDELQEKDQMFKDFENKVDLMAKRVDQAEREKDAAVMRYASVECTAIEAKRAAEKATQAERAAANEVELLNGKLKSAHGEKQRICQLYDDKCHELATSEREVAKIREELRELEGRLKWTQSKLRIEMDAYKESTERVDKLTQQVSELEAAKESAIANASDSLRAKQLEAELKESQAALIMCRHDKEELDRRLSTVSQQFEVCKRERDSASSALALSTAEVEQLKASNLRLEEEAAELAALRAQAALADTLSAQLQRETERAIQAEEERAKCAAAAETCSRREAAALHHAAALTADHVRREAHAHQQRDKVAALTADNSSLRSQAAELEAEGARLRAALADEAARRHQENRVLARKVAELTEEVADVNKRLEWEKGENGVIKKKHASAIKELNRELQRALKRCEQLEAKLPPPDAPSTRTGSVTSLSSGESAPPSTDDRLQEPQADAMPDIQIKDPSVFAKMFPKVREPDRQTLIERIVSLQRAAARRAERCEFLEEHSRQLTGELRGKSRLLRHLLAALPAGAVTSHRSDVNKVLEGCSRGFEYLEEHSRQLTGELRGKSRLLRHLLAALPAGAVTSHRSDVNKKEIAKLGGGAMAAVWGGAADGMTLELSLEMNRRLQAVLEDTLLKNITLKENMDTLGAEISRLKEQKNNPETK